MLNDPSVAVPLDDLVSMIAREREQLVQEIRLSAARECAEIAEAYANEKWEADRANRHDPDSAFQQGKAIGGDEIAERIRQRFGLEKGGENA